MTIADCDRIRSATLALYRMLGPEDAVVQSMPDVSPTKWHLAHLNREFGFDFDVDGRAAAF